MPFPRKTHRLPRDNYLGKRIYFVTICCEKRRPVFTDISLARQALSHLAASAAKHSFTLHSFCLMPDHLHFVAEGLLDDCNLVKFVSLFKQCTAYEYRRAAHRQLWQLNFHDHILRPSDALEDVACYIWLNPVRKGLCANPRLYPLSGSQTIDWMTRISAGTDWTPPWKCKMPPSRQGRDKCRVALHNPRKSKMPPSRQGRDKCRVALHNPRQEERMAGGVGYVALGSRQGRINAVRPLQDQGGARCRAPDKAPDKVGTSAGYMPPGATKSRQE